MKRTIGLGLGLATVLATACDPATPPEIGDGPDLAPSGEPSAPAPPPPGLPDPAGVPRAYGTAPKLAAFIGRWESYTSAEREALSRFGLYSLRASPPEVDDIHQRNPDARLFYRVMPQTVGAADWDRPWSWMDTVREYAVANDWILRHDDGGEATMGGASYWHWLDFTERCPLGTSFNPLRAELDSRGLTAAEWLADRFIPWFVANRFDGYEGLWWEIVAARPTAAWFYFDRADPETGGRLDWDRNGVADFDEGGWPRFDAFATSWWAVAESWTARVRENIGEIPIVGAGDAYAPELEQLDGFKNEDFLNRNRFNGNANWSWWTEFYSQPGDSPRRGYVLQRDGLRRSWSLSVNQIFWYDNGNWSFSNPLLRRRYVRFALGTTLLGDGYFCFYDLETPSAAGEPRTPWIADLYELQLGPYAYPFQRFVAERDTLYVRYFAERDGEPTRVLVVNPNPQRHFDIRAEDAKLYTIRSAHRR